MFHFSQFARVIDQLPGSICGLSGFKIPPEPLHQVIHLNTFKFKNLTLSQLGESPTDDKRPVCPAHRHWQPWKMFERFKRGSRITLWFLTSTLTNTQPGQDTPSRPDLGLSIRLINAPFCVQHYGLGLWPSCETHLLSHPPTLTLVTPWRPIISSYDWS